MILGFYFFYKNEQKNIGFASFKIIKIVGVYWHIIFTPDINFGWDPPLNHSDPLWVGFQSHKISINKYSNKPTQKCHFAIFPDRFKHFHSSHSITDSNHSSTLIQSLPNKKHINSNDFKKLF